MSEQTDTLPRTVRLCCPKCGTSGECWLTQDDPSWAYAETAEMRTLCFDCLCGRRKPMTYHREDGSEIYRPEPQLADELEAAHSCLVGVRKIAALSGHESYRAIGKAIECVEDAWEHIAKLGQGQV